MSISFLDCTLRDGAHVNSGNFGKSRISSIISGLTKSSIDVVEIGFLKNVSYDADVTSYPHIEDAYEMLSHSHTDEHTMYALMARADQYDINDLSDCNGKIELIRIAFYYDDLDKAVEFAHGVEERGYKYTLNLINTPGNSLNDLGSFIDRANLLKPFAVTIVDTFGVLGPSSMMAIARLYSEKLNPDIRIGLHVHENLSLAFSMAQVFIQEVGLSRDIIVDGSLMGMGRAPGNLCTELIANYLNSMCGKGIVELEILKLISEEILPIKSTHKWGYSPEYFVSAKYCVHRSYAEYMSDRGMRFDLIDKVLSAIDREHALRFSEPYLKDLIEEIRRSD